MKHPFDEVYLLAVILNNTISCSLDDAREIKYVSNTGKIARISDRLDLSGDAKPVEHRPEAVELNSPRVDCKHGSDVDGRDT